MVRLSVNIDHVATVREARKTVYPDPVQIARLAEEAGASGITVHLRSDRRHIQDSDLPRLAEAVRGRLNVEMAATEEMVAIALATRPHLVTLVPERPEEVTTEGGLDLVRFGEPVLQVASRLADAGIEVSLFLDPEPRQLEQLERRFRGAVTTFELNTDAYAKGWPDAGRQLDALVDAAREGGAHGFAVAAGHALTTENVGPVVRIPEVEELNIGHFLIGRAIAVGIPTAVREMLNAMAATLPPGAP
jgi:pyridoxine 5-phosphate synthase